MREQVKHRAVKPTGDLFARSVRRPARALASGRGRGLIDDRELGLGNHALQRLLRSGAAPATLTLDPRDAAERQADRMADTVLRLPSSHLEATTAARGPRGDPHHCPTCRAALERGSGELCDACAGGSRRPDAGGGDARRPTSAVGGGHPLPESVRAYFEPRFGRDFSQVRVHTGGASEASAAALHAEAFTVGRHIVFGRDRYAPQTTEGKALLAHELAHVVQQQTTGVVTVQAAVDPSKPRCSCDKEREAMEQAAFETDVAYDWWQVAKALLELAQEKARVQCTERESPRCAEATTQLEAERQKTTEAEKHWLITSVLYSFAQEDYEDCLPRCAPRRF